MPILNGYKKWNYVVEHGALPPKHIITYDVVDPLILQARCSTGGLHISNFDCLVELISAAIRDDPLDIRNESVNGCLTWASDPGHEQVFSNGDTFVKRKSRGERTNPKHWQAMRNRLLEWAAMLDDGHMIIGGPLGESYRGDPVFPWTREFRALA